MIKHSHRVLRRSFLPTFLFDILVCLSHLFELFDAAAATIESHDKVTVDGGREFIPKSKVARIRLVVDGSHPSASADPTRHRQKDQVERNTSNHSLSP